MPVTRREFFGGVMALAAGKAAADGGSEAAPVERGKRVLDPCSIAVISDIHTGLPRAQQQYRTGQEYPWMPEAVEKSVAEILALPNPPANVIGLGDLSLAFGEPGDYEVAARVLKPLEDAGIKVTHTMGNHDIRAEFLRFFPGYDRTTKVPGRFVSVVETPHVDFILLDSLKEPTVRGSYPACTGYGLGDEQTAWLKDTLASCTKPVFVCAHHMADTLGLRGVISRAKTTVGYLHGHHHHWMTNYIHADYSRNVRVVRQMGFPSFGLDTDVGWGLLVTKADKATLWCRNRDFYFPVKKPQEERPASWDAHVRDWAGRKIEFAYEC